MNSQHRPKDVTTIGLMSPPTKSDSILTGSNRTGAHRDDA
ncbi:hypothetical protein P3T25_008884 [Paraburkholderia sp. GAS32]